MDLLKINWPNDFNFAVLFYKIKKNIQSKDISYMLEELLFQPINFIKHFCKYFVKTKRVYINSLTPFCNVPYNRESVIYLLNSNYDIIFNWKIIRDINDYEICCKIIDKNRDIVSRGHIYCYIFGEGRNDFFDYLCKNSQLCLNTINRCRCINILSNIDILNKICDNYPIYLKEYVTKIIENFDNKNVIYKLYMANLITVDELNKIEN